MSVLLFLPVKGAVAHQLQSAIDRLSPVLEPFVCHSIQELRHRLLCRTECGTIAVLLTPSRTVLSDVVELEEMLSSTRVILVLPDNQRSTVAEAHRLRPRFLTYVDSNFNEIADVLRKMLGNGKQTDQEHKDELQERIA
jgi:hypothetical protein